MKFDPSLPDEDINVERRSLLRDALVLVTGIAGLLGVAVFAVSVGVDWLVPRLPVDLEVRLFSRLPNFGEGSADPDPRTRAATTVLNRLAAHWRDNPYDLQLTIWDSPEINAVAFPGGRIAISTGLLGAVASENELAFVLGHELGHFRNRDHLRGLGRGVTVALLTASIGQSLAGSGAEFAALAGRLAERVFDRDQEREADRFGLELLFAEYGHVGGAAEFFRQVPETASGRTPLSGYLATHPLDGDRIRAVDQAAADNAWPATGRLVPPPGLTSD